MESSSFRLLQAGSGYDQLGTSRVCKDARIIHEDEPIVLWLDFTKKLWYASFEISTALKSRFSVDN
ncbi:hypothetical protein CY35_07G128200 [Sphagnum magellanicum]|uniref:Uncharacterized protein n=1 Tax=Sphagnum magellanicum TaxID=128215 RepID=A0ACB8HQ73_9BRYO|nr:hypothetical protein CY35_07G128200 [Sphagnum magellanicum]